MTSESRLFRIGPELAELGRDREAAGQFRRMLAERRDHAETVMIEANTALYRHWDEVAYRIRSEVDRKAADSK